MGDENEYSIKGLLIRIQGWEVELKELSKKTSEIQKRKNEAFTTLWGLVNDE